MLKWSDVKTSASLHLSDLYSNIGWQTIPRMFVENYGEGLPKTVFLKPPNGVEWKLSLIKHDGEVWFQKGWKEFEWVITLSSWRENCGF